MSDGLGFLVCSASSLRSELVSPWRWVSFLSVHLPSALVRSRLSEFYSSSSMVKHVAMCMVPTGLLM